QLDLRINCDPVPLLRAAQRRHPTDCWVNFLLGSLLVQKDAADAVGFLRAALVVRPDSSVIRNNLGVAFEELKLTEEAIAAYRDAIRLEPGHARPRHNLGITLARKGRLDEAVATYRQAIRINP